MIVLQHSVLEALESAPNYNSWAASLVLPYLGPDPLEIGSGTGTTAERLLEAGAQRLTLSEVDPDLVERLRERFAGDARVEVRQLDLLAAGSGEHSTVFALNVLEHIEDDIAALGSAAQLVRPGGGVVFFVPAFGFAMSRFDREIGHYRRYTKGSAERACRDAGLEVEELRYVNVPGLAAWTVGMRLLRMRPHDNVVLRGWDRAVIPFARRLEEHVPAPFGQSLLAVGRAPS